MLTHFIRKYGLAYTTALVTLFTIAVSLFITSVVWELTNQPNLGIALLTATICPLLITPPVTFFYNRLLLELNDSKDRLQQALSEVKTLKGLIPICAACKNIRDDQGYWNQIERFITEHSEAEFSHSICPECAKELYPDVDLYPDHPKDDDQ